jgi:hypothetical protein
MGNVEHFEAKIKAFQFTPPRSGNKTNSMRAEWHCFPHKREAQFTLFSLFSFFEIFSAGRGERERANKKPRVVIMHLPRRASKR